ncbi:MAG TPA: nucleoside 2-deoxyribosyltransferase [Candidatus Saccharimonadia bacterium]|jgi:nucleoside 2-deoxyribosyltransferase
MRVFVSYRHTGAEAKTIRPLLETVKRALEDKGVEIHNTFFDVRQGDFVQSELGPAGFMHEAFGMMERSDFLLVLQNSEERSEGMLMEVGYALAKKMPVLVAVQDEVKNTYLPDMAELVVKWRDTVDLAVQLGKVDFERLVRG